MDLHHFFDGAQSREETASAFLATLLEYDEAFRREFLARAFVDASLDPSQPWKVLVEDWRTGAGGVDITVELDSTVVLIENKIASAAMRTGQLLEYYLGAVRRWPDKRIVALYLAPTTDMGRVEVALVERSSEFQARQDRPLGPDTARPVAWGDIGAIIDALPENRGWFASTGMMAVQRAIDAAVLPLPPDAQRDAVRGIVKAAMRSLAVKVPYVQLGHWPSFDQEAIYTVKAPVTVFVTAVFDVDPEPSFKLRDVVEAGRVRLTVNSEFMLASKVPKSSVVARKWRDLLEAGPVDIPGVGLFVIRGDKRFAHSANWDGPEAELADFLAETGWRVLEHLRPFFSLPMGADSTSLGLATANGNLGD